MNDRESLFFSSRTLWFALNSSCSVIDIVDATAVSKQNIFGGFQAIVDSLSLNNTAENIFTDELPVNDWELMSVTNSHHNLPQFFSAAFSSPFKHIVSTTESPQLLSHYKDAQTALFTAIGAWPPCIIAYLPGSLARILLACSPLRLWQGIAPVCATRPAWLLSVMPHLHYLIQPLP
jgi:hypothetical protein